MTTVPATRRTQRERRKATRDALLEATIQCLVEQGYAGTTTRAVAKRAGVSTGALQHHFASKQELVSEAVSYLTDKLAAQLVEKGIPSAPSRRQLIEQLLDYLWETQNGPLTAADTELAVAGRTDPVLRERLVEAQRQALESVPLVAGQLFPEQDDSADFIGLINTVLAAMRGVVLLGFVSSADQEEVWRAARGHLVAMVEAWQG